MRHVFLLYIPPSNMEAVVHYEDTIKKRVPLDTVRQFLSRNEAVRLQDVFGEKRIAVWGSRDSDRNRAIFEKMSPGDDLLIIEGKQIKLLGKVALKTVSPELSRTLWKQINKSTSNDWSLIYFIANPLEIDVPFAAFCRMFGYNPNLQLRGFSTVKNDRLAAFYKAYDDLYSVLLKLRAKQPIAKKELPAADSTPPLAAAPSDEEPDESRRNDRSPKESDHVKMQWKLARLGRKAGEKVWVPTADQNRLRDIYSFDEFEAEFATGIDLPKNFFENIDVVWKEEFRINAAFEVENSTAIYSGLLRFADLNVVAPNTAYPMFIVAPSERRNRVRDQLKRPVFQRLELREKVLFLPYETVDEIDQFFSTSTAGVSVDLVKARAEVLV